MTLTKEQIKIAAIELDPVDRETLAEELLLSIGESERQTIDAAWLDEARRRDAAFRTGATGTRPVEDVVDSLRL